MPVPATWAGVDAALRTVAPQVRLLVADATTGTCQPLHSIDPAAAAPLGSVSSSTSSPRWATAVAAGKVRWTQPLTVAAPLKSLPSGHFQDQPDGTRISVQDTAAKMISISDNTAADMLINLLGRPAVETALTTTWMASPSPGSAVPDHPRVVQAQAQPMAGRSRTGTPPRTKRAGVRCSPAPSTRHLFRPWHGASWTAPATSTASNGSPPPTQPPRLHVPGCARPPGLAPMARSSLNDGGLELDPAQWKTTWFKGGSEPGVLTLAYRATTRTGHSYVVIVLAEIPPAIMRPPRTRLALGDQRGVHPRGGRLASGMATMSPKVTVTRKRI